MKYKLDFSVKVDVSSPPATGAVVAAESTSAFMAWQPSTWPDPPAAVDERFVLALKRIFEESILGEISNVVADVQKQDLELRHRGHVIALALMCALDAISSYGYRGRHMADFIGTHFPSDYHPYRDQIYGLYRCSLVHKWNLFQASIYPDNTRIKTEGGTIAFGLLNFFEALAQGTADFLEHLAHDALLQKNTLKRYKELREAAKP